VLTFRSVGHTYDDGARAPFCPLSLCWRPACVRDHFRATRRHTGSHTHWWCMDDTIGMDGWYGVVRCGADSCVMLGAARMRPTSIFQERHQPVDIYLIYNLSSNDHSHGNMAPRTNVTTPRTVQETNQIPDETTNQSATLCRARPLHQYRAERVAASQVHHAHPNMCHSPSRPLTHSRMSEITCSLVSGRSCSSWWDAPSYKTTRFISGGSGELS